VRKTTDKPPRRRRGRPPQGGPPVVDEARCLHAALEVFAGLGYEGTSVREIARRMGISHGLLNARFGAKHALWMAAVCHGMDQLHGHMARIEGGPDEQADLVEQMRRACLNFLLGLVEVPAIIQLMNTEGARRSERLDHIVATFFRRRTWRIHTLLKQGQKAGVFRKLHVAVPFTLLAHGAGALVVLRPLAEAVDARLGKPSGKLMRAAEEAVDLIVRGLLARGSPGPGHTSRRSPTRVARPGRR